MSRVNPLHILLLSFVFLIFSFVQFHTVSQKIEDMQSELKKKRLVATELVALQKVYGNKVKVKRSLEKILRHSLIRKAKIEKDYSKNGVVLKADSVDLRVLNAFMGKILNNSFHITKLKIKKLSEKRATFEVGIKW